LIAWLKAAEQCKPNPPCHHTFTSTPQDVKQNGILAKIPMSAAIWFPASYGDFAELGATVAREVAKGGRPAARLSNTLVERTSAAPWWRLPAGS
jgi:hypothetical protein